MKITRSLRQFWLMCILLSFSNDSHAIDMGYLKHCAKIAGCFGLLSVGASIPVALAALAFQAEWHDPVDIVSQSVGLVAGATVSAVILGTWYYCWHDMEPYLPAPVLVPSSRRITYVHGNGMPVGVPDDDRLVVTGQPVNPTDRPINIFDEEQPLLTTEQSDGILGTEDNA